MLICGAAWICLMFLVYAFVGTYALDSANPMNTPVAGTILIVVTCLVIVAFAITWGPLVWTIVSELYPTQYRAPCVALATSSNWLFNFLISFFTTFVTDKIHYWYGMVFAGACAALCVLVYFFVVESKDRTLEEIDTMYLLHVNPITSAKWTAKDLVVDENGLRTDGAVIGAGGEVMGNVQAEKSELVHSHY
jgi:SP family sugar:H+ symporter-like MFS transporter